MDVGEEGRAFPKEDFWPVGPLPFTSFLCQSPFGWAKINIRPSNPGLTFPKGKFKKKQNAEREGCK
jgi:hypothetical protein